MRDGALILWKFTLSLDRQCHNEAGIKQELLGVREKTQTLHIGSATKIVGVLVNLTVIQSLLRQVIPNDPTSNIPNSLWEL